MNVLADAHYTADDLLRMNGDHHFELVDGRLVEKIMGARSSRVGTILGGHMNVHANGRQLGPVFDGQCGYVLFPDRNNRVRKPDVSFVRRERIPADGIPEGWFHLVPDLAVEIISPNDTVQEVAARVADYLRARVPLFWLIDPPTRLVQVFRADGTGYWLLGSGELKGEDVLPGFSCRVEDLFTGM